ncbi:hypothetical protein Cgig2_030065 [Carnegiea gigantea]|uniref:Uncharacterized protein n=1 Tax=Carnegiea gigantea TaxID=171969 RepID=A0A9Q1JI32_9CARY|nr:hypothetical protein Cgig2_030065 [Carnegiea gigantea]
MGGIEVQLHEIQSFSECITACELHETNTTIWTRIDRAFVNAYWFNPFDFCQVLYIANSLSDHTALVMDFPWCPKPKPYFQFYDMWVRDPSFIPLMASIKSQLSPTDPITKMERFLKNARSALQKLNKNKYTNLRTQLCKARADLEGVQLLLSQNPGDQEWLQKADMTRTHYIHILSSSSKARWIGYGEDCTRYFFTKIKQRKTATYILSIQDDQGQIRQGFSKVKELCAPFIDQGIKSVMFFIPNTKSPGPDGFHSGFFKATWKMTGELSMGDIAHNHNSNALNSQGTKRVICLLDI